MPLDDLVRRWEQAYRDYGSASELVASRPAGDRDAARLLANASREVSAAWREIAGPAGLPWWVLAALGTAAEAFEEQARSWSARAAHGGAAPVARPRARHGARPARPVTDHEKGERP